MKLGLTFAEFLVGLVLCHQSIPSNAARQNITTQPNTANNDTNKSMNLDKQDTGDSGAYQYLPQYSYIHISNYIVIDMYCIIFVVHVIRNYVLQALRRIQKDPVWGNWWSTELTIKVMRLL